MKIASALSALVLVGALALVGPNQAAPKTDAENPISAIVADAGGMWAWLNTYELVRVDPGSNRVAARTATRPALITDLAVGEGGVLGER